MEDYNSNAEKSVLSSILSDNTILEDLDLRVTDFYSERHRTIFSKMKELYRNGKPVDLVNMIDALQKENIYDDIGGIAYLSELDMYNPVASNYKSHAEIIKDCSLRRGLYKTLGEISSRTNDCENISELIEEAQQKLTDLTDFVNVKEAVPLEESAGRYAEILKQREGRNDFGIMSGFADLDRMTGGFKRGNFIVLAARPAMGKTTLAMNFAEGISRHGTVLFFSLEMSEEQLLDRLYKSEALLSRTNISEGSGYKDAIDYLSMRLARLKLYIYDDSRVTISDIRRTAKRVKHKSGSLDLLVIDYLQLMKSEKRHDSRVQEVSDLTRDLKVLARELDVPIVVLSQLNRGVELREDKRPQLSDLRESGSIEQDADIVMMLYRHGYYDPEAEDKSITDLLIRKNRSGSVGGIKLFFYNEATLFRSLDRTPERDRLIARQSAQEDDDDED